MLYVFGWGTLAVDGKWVGAVSGNSDYFVLPIDPGEHHLYGQFSTRTGPAALPLIKIRKAAFHSLEATPGGTYYLDLRVRSYYDFALNLLDPDEGKYLLASSTFSTSRPK